MGKSGAVGAVGLIQGYTSMFVRLMDLLLAIGSAALRRGVAILGAGVACLNPVGDGAESGWTRGDGTGPKCSFTAVRDAILLLRRKALPGSHQGTISLAH